MPILCVQHVLVMFAAMVGSPLALARTLDLPSHQAGAMIAGCMLGCGVGTALAASGLGALGSRLPIVLGISSIFVAPIIEIARQSDLGSVAGASLICGLLTGFASPLLARVRALLPGVVLGTILLVTGLTLLKIATNLLFAGSPSATGLGLFTLLLILVMAASGSNLRIVAVFVGFLCGYSIAALAGMIDFTAVQRAPMFTAPALLPFGISWPSIFTLAIMLVCFIVAVVETAIQSVAVAQICGVSGDTTRARRAITADAFGSIVSALFGGLPLTSYSQNIGVITLTGVGSRAVVAGCGAILIALSFLPSISLGISLTPAPVIGGALLFMFGTIVILGIDLLGDLRKPRDRSIVTISLSLSLAVTFASHEQLSILPDIARALAGQGIVVGTIVAIVANIVLPGRAYIKDDVVEDRSRLGGSTEAG